MSGERLLFGVVIPTLVGWITLGAVVLPGEGLSWIRFGVGILSFCGTTWTLSYVFNVWLNGKGV